MNRTHTGAIAAVVLGLAISVASAQVNSGGTARNGSNLAGPRAEVEKARTKLRAAVDKVRTTWKANPKYIEATDALDAARKDYDSARAAVIEKLKRDDPVYRELLQTQADTQGKLAQEQAKVNAAVPAATQPGDAKELPGPSAGQVQAATEKLEAKAKLRNLEDIAVTKDPDAKKASEKLKEAQTAAKVWQAQLDAALKTDADYTAALEQMRTARAALQTAAGQQNSGPDYNDYGETNHVWTFP
jgi:chromosome segregation ATPase